MKVCVASLQGAACDSPKTVPTYPSLLFLSVPHWDAPPQATFDTFERDARAAVLEGIQIPETAIPSIPLIFLPYRKEGKGRRWVQAPLPPTLFFPHKPGAAVFAALRTSGASLKV